MIKSKIDYKNYIDADLKRSQKKKFEKLSEIFELSETAIIRKYLRILRKTELYKNTNNIFLYAIYEYKHRKLSNKYSIHIPINTCEKGLKIMHLGPILINGKAHIGENCSIHINVSIVAGGTTNDCPVVGKNVVIGVGAVILRWNKNSRQCSNSEQTQLLTEMY